MYSSHMEPFVHSFFLLCYCSWGLTNSRIFNDEYWTRVGGLC